MSYIKINIIYVFLNGKSKFKVSTSYFFGLIKPEVFPDEDNHKENNRSDKEKKSENNAFSASKYMEYMDIFQYFMDKVIVEDLNWRTKVGYKDPFYLSLIYGGIWWIKSLFNSFLLSKKDIDNIKIEVVPYYNSNLTDIRFNCIIKIRIAYIINIWIRFLKINKGGANNDRTSHRRSNENNNEQSKGYG